MSTVVVSGALGGVAIGFAASSRSAAALGLLLAALVGALGCALAGLIGLPAMAGALVAASVPVYLLAHPRRASS